METSTVSAVWAGKSDGLCEEDALERSCLPPLQPPDRAVPGGPQSRLSDWPDYQDSQDRPGSCQSLAQESLPGQR